MALESPLVASPGNLMSAFSPYTEFSLSPNSPALANSPRFKTASARSSLEGSNLRPYSIDDSLSPSSAQMASPSDMVGPSPVTSNGTATTEIEDEAADDMQNGEPTRPDFSRPSTANSSSVMTRLSTNIPDHFRTSLDDESVSVIHAPMGYGNFNAPKDPTPSPPRTTDRSTPTPYQQQDIVSDTTLRVDLHVANNKITGAGPVSPPAISTDIPAVKYGLENATPRAQTRQEVEAFSNDSGLYRSNSSHSSLEGIPEEFETPLIHDSDHEVRALKTALHECWTLCNTLANMSSVHRERIFSYSGTRDAHEMAWKCCWKLCKKLYDSRDEDHETHVRPTLDLCRDFCQALFDVRQRKDEFADSVLRVSFELNNHLFNTHDRNLPEAFRERTLDFYITLCHRLMKQRNELAAETDALLRACWGLAEMLFSLRQNKREGKAADEELLGSAVQACWELGDLFREGWTQVRPERGTPRPSQTTFTQTSDQMSRSSHNKSASLASLASLPENPEHPEHARTRYQPETPTTEFEDTPISPEGNSPNIPNIMILGVEGNRATNARWSSTTSTLSSYSQGSGHSSSTVTTAQNGGAGEDANLTRLKILILKAAMNVGFSRSTPSTNPSHPSSSSSSNTTSTAQDLPAFVQTLYAGSLGPLPSHAILLEKYKALVLGDSTFRSERALPDKGSKASAQDVAGSVRWLMRSGQFLWLRDLFRLVFGFAIEEAGERKHVSITV